VASPTRWKPDSAQRNVTIEDVARAAGVGRQTVSNVLNGSGRVGTAARARVLEAVAQLGYHPHHGARSLRSRRTMQLGYLMPQTQLRPQNLIMMQFVQSLVTEASRRQYRVVVVTAGGDPRDDMRRLISSRSVDAFVLSELELEDPRVVLLHELGMPFACFGRIGPGLPQSWVDIDNSEAEAQVVQLLLDLGLTRLCFIGYATGRYWDGEREAGFRAGLASRGVAGDSAGMLVIGDDSSARDKIFSFIASAKPDAVVAGSDKIAVIVYGVASDLNLQVGRDIAVVGFDGSIGADLVHPALTSVVMPVEDIARRVVTRALRQVETGQDTEPGEFVPFWLRRGDSIPLRRRG
jgi:DNA-binding LacI/PurR family transcriptional regulator